MKKLLVMIAMALPIIAMAQQKEDYVISESEATFQMAVELSSYGYANNDALSLIQAARIAKQQGYVKTDGSKTTEGGTQESGKKRSHVCLEYDILLSDARDIAKNDGVLLALIDDVAKNTRGAVGGPKYATDCVRAGATDIYRVSFRAGERAEIAVVGDGDTDLDLYIYDENGNLITYDNDYTDRCYCIFTPRWTGSFTIKIVNRGHVMNCYVIRTN